MSTETYQFPLSPTQEALLYTQLIDPKGSAYNIPVASKLKGSLDVAVLKKAFEAIVHNNEILRTVYISEESANFQVVQTETEIQFSENDLSENPAEEIEQSLSDALARDVSIPFDLRNGPVVRAHYYRLSEQEHCLLFVFHHIAMDHSAVELCMSQLADAYQKIASGQPPADNVEGLQYADYVIWLEENSQAQDKQSKIEQWKKMLEGYSGTLDLPMDQPRQPIPSGKGAQYLFDFDPNMSERVKQFSKSQGVSVYLATLAAFKIFLHRITNQDDIVVGTPFTHRAAQDELQDVVGCFINTLPLASNLTEVDDYSSLIGKVKKTMLEAYELQDVPFGAIVNAVNPVRDASFNPLFQVGFIVQEAPVGISLPGMISETLLPHSCGAMYDLHVWLWTSGERIQGLCWYNTDIYDHSTIVRLIASYETLLSELIENPDSNFDQVRLITNSDKDALLKWNDTVTPNRDEQRSILDLIDASAKSQPEKIAVICGEVSLTYSELDQRADAMANHLLSKNVGRGSLVGICLNRSTDMLVALLGIMRAGGTYVPLDPEYPFDRLQYMVQKSETALIVTESELVEQIPVGGCETILIDRDWDLIAASDAHEKPAIAPGDNMYVIFTSGSTGLPKGVQVPHSAVLNFIQSMAKKPGMGLSDKLLAVTTLSFDIAVLELYLPLSVGATLVVADNDETQSGDKLLELIDRHGINTMQATPVTWRLLIEAGWQGSNEFKALCGGEAFPADLALPLIKRTAQIWNMYGPTETTVWSACTLIDEENAENITIGTPIDNTQCYILNEKYQLQPVGIAGELYIGGDGVTNGYLGQPELSAERFIANPFSDTNETKLYQTGDVARWTENGSLEYISRIDNQVKVRGFRIELGEIETVLMEHETVKAAACHVWQRTEADEE